MAVKKTCPNCQGSGSMMGGGMLRVDCNKVDCVEGFIYLEDRPIVLKSPKIDKRSASFKAAIKELMDLGLTKKEAEAKFLEAEENLNREAV